MNLSLKHKLMLQSLSPLAFLTIVRNFKFTPVSELAENQSYWGEFVRLNNVLIVVFLLCATWILAAIMSNFCSVSEISLSALSDTWTFVSGCLFLFGSVTRKTPFAVSNSGWDGQVLYARSIFPIPVP